MTKKKRSLAKKIFFTISDPVVIFFAFFWGTFGQLLIPIFYLLYFLAIFFVFVPTVANISPIVKMTTEELLSVRILSLFYLLLDFGLVILFNGLKDGIKRVLKKFSIFVLVYLFIGIIFLFLGSNFI